MKMQFLETLSFKNEEDGSDTDTCAIASNYFKKAKYGIIFIVHMTFL